MWNWFNCYLSGRHEFGVWCEPGTIFLRCVHCGKRSSGWAIHPGASTAPPGAPTVPVGSAPRDRHVVPFSRAAAR